MNLYQAALKILKKSYQKDYEALSAITKWTLVFIFAI
jgi:hypothetical protein